MGVVNHRSGGEYKIIKDPQHEEYEEMLEWLGGDDFDPAYFDVNEVNFRDPDKRLRIGLGSNRRGSSSIDGIAKRKKPKSL